MTPPQPTGAEAGHPRPGTGWKLFLVLAGLSCLTYWPALDNGYISDDYIALERAQRLVQQPLHLWEIPPENFRSTTYGVFWLVTAATGHHPWCFYLLKMFVHALVALLLCRLVWLASGNRVASLSAALLFVCFQNPHEAIMWLTGTHELLLTLSVLAAVVCWLEGRWGFSLAFYCLGLFSKESAPVLLALLPVAGWWRRENVPARREYYYFLIPTLAFALLFLSGVSSNSLVAHRFYAFGPGAIEVGLKSVHALAFPWLYLALLLAWLTERRLPWMSLRGPLMWTMVALLPYLFLTYQDHVPSRHEYLPSLGLAAALGIVLSGYSRPVLRNGFLVFFALANMGYIWMVKDAQFEERAAPTRELLMELDRIAPQPVRIEGFPLNPWIARMTTRLLAGWWPDLVLVDAPPAACRGCPTLRWEQNRQGYLRLPPVEFPEP